MTPATPTRPDVRYLVAAGLLGFVLGAFVVGSLGSMRGVTSGTPVKFGEGAVDESGTDVKVPAPTSGHTTVIGPEPPDAKHLAARHLSVPVDGVSPASLVRTYHEA